MPTQSWHEAFCRKADIFVVDNVPACISCGSVYRPNTIYRSELSVVTPVARGFSKRERLDLHWPATITFTSPDQIEDLEIRASLQWFQRLLCAEKTRDVNDQEDNLQSNVTGPAESNERLGSKQHVSGTSSQNPVYKPLTGWHEIRLLRLSPALLGDDQVLHGTLLLSQLADRPEFTALSYTWADTSGDRSCSETIFIGPEWEALPITRNCAAALRRLRSRQDDVVIWVDAICIDQDNIGERSHQVGLMRDVYSRARKVVAFLGDDGDNQTPESQLMHRMSEECFYSGTSVKLSWDPVRDGVALRALFNRPYWRRIWVIQEILLSKEAYIVLGGNSVPLSCILHGHMTGHGADAAIFFPSWTKVSGPSLDGDCDAFSQLLLKTSSCQALDPRDRVFALLGLVQGAHLEGLVADYTKTSEEVYIGIAAYFIIRHGQTNILMWATVSSHSSLTWVPAWQPHPQWAAHLGKELGDDRWAQSWDFLKASYRVSEYGGKFEDLTWPSHVCRASAEDQGIGDVLNILQPRVCHNTGALILRAYTVLHLDSSMLKDAFFDDQSVRSEEEFLLRPSTGMTTCDQDPFWAIYGLRPRFFGSKKGPRVNFVDEWILEVPNCNALLYLRPRGLVPGVYRIASVLYLTLLSDVDIKPLTSMEKQEGSHFDDYILLLRLVMFEPHHISFLQSWSTLVEKNAAVHRVQTGVPLLLSPSQLTQYTHWLDYIKLHPTSPTGPVAEESNSVLKSTLKTVSSYLDEWADLSTWDHVSELLDSIKWSEYAFKLERLRQHVMSDITAHSENREHGDKVYHSCLLNRSFSSRSEMCGILSDKTKHLLEEILDELMTAVDDLELEGLSAETMFLGTFKFSETANRLGKAVNDIMSWDIEQVVAEQDELLSEWIEFGSHLRHMHRSRTEYVAIRNKFIQRHVLRRLYTRCELREFIIS